ncbi:hypothetical protein [Roseateles sp.]|jgi:hypothetical protein|uniref:hypothetical protein n=1 Tax=Roseateles sp. TaxID=1971397 RepID=UPI003BA5B6FA
MSANAHSPLWLNICRRLELDPETPGTLDRAYEALRPHIGRGTLQRIQRHEGEPRYASIKSIATALSCTPAELIEPSQGKHQTGEPFRRYSALPDKPQAHGVSYQAETVPTLKWEELMQTKDLPAAFWIALTDDALAPKLPKGTVVRFTQGIEPVWGQVVLLRDAKGKVHARVHMQDAEHDWRAAATSPVYTEFKSGGAGVKRLAVMTAIETTGPMFF